MVKALELHNVTLSTESQISYTFSVNRGSLCQLVGGINSPRSHLLTVLGLRGPITSGTVSVLGREANGLSRQRRYQLNRQISFISRQCRLLPYLTVFDNLALPLRLQGITEQLVQKYCNEMLEWLGLRDLCNRYGRNLSLGQMRVLTIAQGVIAQPELLLIDEPVLGMDPDWLKKILYLILELANLGMTVVISIPRQMVSTNLTRLEVQVIDTSQSCNFMAPVAQADLSTSRNDSNGTVPVTTATGKTMEFAYN